MRSLLISLLVITFSHSALAQAAPAATAKKDTDLVTIGPDGEPKYTLGYGGRNWKGEDPRKDAKASDKDKSAPTTAASAAPAPAAAAASKDEKKKTLRSDSTLKSDATIAREKREAAAKAAKAAQEASKNAAAAAGSPPAAPAEPAPMTPTNLPK